MNKVLGIRNYSDGFRYCILEKCNKNITFVNKDIENKITKPKDYEGRELYLWFQNEIKRILDTNNGIEALAIKQNENNVQTCYKKIKDIMFFDCIASMSAFEKNVSVYSYVYNQLGTNSKNVKQVAESIINGPTAKYWDDKIADAIVAANKLFSI